VSTDGRPVLNPTKGRIAAACLLATAVLASAAPLAAQPEHPEADPEASGGHEPEVAAVGFVEGLDEWAESIADAGRQWDGPRVRFPDTRPRPLDEGWQLRSTWYPVTVHAEPGVREERARAALAALESAYLALDELGWPLPVVDGGRGDGDGFDLYLRAQDAFESDEPSAPLERPAPLRFERAGLDVPTTFIDLDGAITFAEMADGVDPQLVPACAVVAYADALLLSMDPAEAPAWRRATATYLSYLVTSRFGCDESLVVEQQTASERGFVSHAPGSGEGGALLLGAISARHDDETGSFIRDLWNATRQYTREGGDLHALPDVYHVIAQGVAIAHDPLTQIVEDFGASRYFAGLPSRERPTAYPILGALPRGAAVPVFARADWEHLPRTLRFDRELEPYGSGYAAIDVHGAPAGGRLRVWLRGEFGVEWSLIAIRLDARGDEIARMRAPPRPTPESYLPVELLEGTAEVILAVTNISARGLDADEPDDFVRSFTLTVDRPRDAAATP
jgi:hypothetical protein